MSNANRSPIGPENEQWESELARLNELDGLYCADLKVIAGGSVILYLHEVDQLEGDSLSTWRLHIEPAWRLEAGQIFLLGSSVLDFFETLDDDLRKLIGVLKTLLGRKLLKVHVGKPVVDLTLVFEGELVFKTFASATEGERWELRCMDGYRLGMQEPWRMQEWLNDPDQ